MNPLCDALHRKEVHKLSWDLAIECIHDIDIRSALARYGVQVDRSGFASCPFHGETRGSLKVYDNNSFYCFGCNTGGDLIKFVAKLYNSDFRTTVTMICKDYGIPLNNYGVDVGAYHERKRTIADESAKRKAQYIILFDEYLDALEEWLNCYSRIPLREQGESHESFSERFFSAENFLPLIRETEARYKLECAEDALNDYVYKMKHGGVE